MRILLIITCLANIAFAFGSLPWLPEQIAVHYSPDGTVNRYESPFSFVALACILPCIIASFMLGISFMMSFSVMHMPEQFNIPNSDYWMNEENRPKTAQRIAAFTIDLFGIGMMLLFLLMHWELVRVNLTVPPGQPNTDVILYGLIVCMVVWAFGFVYLYLSFRLPKTETQ
jgi:uncharacterized membrane protein